MAFTINRLFFLVPLAERKIMTSTGVDFAAAPPPFDDKRGGDPEKRGYDQESPIESVSIRSSQQPGDHTHRQLKPRHIQLIGW
ncbi:general amino acid permease agp2 [Diplodia seriata]|uniref:General amino acid permease agp2 n=1 Tax=Diplodia seriata TaxID=420778 RepID=A0ABR3CKB9_9PEZI